MVMATWARSCTVTKCEISSCAVCHCCQKDLCLDHLKEHKDQLNAKLIPLTNQINISLESLERFTPTSLPSFKALEQWRITAHETVDQFYEQICHELFEQKRNQPLEKLRATRDVLKELIRKQGATHENINSLTNVIQSIEEEINDLQNIQINLRPLWIDKNVILQSNSVESNNVFETIRKDNNFQIFAELLTGKKILIMVKPSDTILEIKCKIQEKEGIPPDQQYLLYLGKILKDEYTAATYDLQRHCMIQCKLRLRDQKPND